MLNTYYSNEWMNEWEIKYLVSLAFRNHEILELKKGPVESLCLFLSQAVLAWAPKSCRFEWGASKKDRKRSQHWSWLFLGSTKCLRIMASWRTVFSKIILSYQGRIGKDPREIIYHVISPLAVQYRSLWLILTIFYICIVLSVPKVPSKTLSPLILARK